VFGRRDAQVRSVGGGFPQHFASWSRTFSSLRITISAASQKHRRRQVRPPVTVRYRTFTQLFLQPLRAPRYMTIV
jgi:hypothetical protein